MLACHRTISHPIRSGFVLLLTVVMLALLAAALSQLVFLSGSTAVITARRNADLDHRLAVDSAIALVGRQMTAEPRWLAQLQRDGVVRETFNVGPCTVRVTVRDDGGKFNVGAFTQPPDRRLLETKLRRLERVMRLPPMKIRLQPQIATDRKQPDAYRWYDQLFDRPQAHHIFALSDNTLTSSRPRWSDIVTVFGDGRLDLKRADNAVIGVMLGDLVPGIERQIPIPRARNASSAQDLLGDVLADVDERTRSALLRRVTWNTGRYAMGIRTAMQTPGVSESDVRRWYVVATLGQGDPEILYRGRIEW